ncbi:hypothetical protein [Actinomycetospora chiangmaiensis]|uniref:hypothetical protein n=1 Tax=Actinomycetospora chiangmaiensis TaxID=402650 RepID=UPI000365A233|nr:hypothetical protein [Actinomycetospora chiangmaiensis]
MTQPSGESPVDREVAAAAMSPKVTWAAASSALATIVWTIVGAVDPALFPASEVAVLTGATATILAFLGGYFVRDPLRHQP